MRPLSASLGLLASALLGTLALHRLATLLPPLAAEPLVWRWARTAGHHPWRTTLALWLIGVALGPRCARSLPIWPGAARGRGPSELE